MTVLRVDFDDDDFEFDDDQSARYKGELLTGVLFEYFPNGTLANETGYKDGKAFGLSRFWYDDGTLESEAMIDRSGVVGVARTWHPNGALAEETSYENGAPVETRKWDENGNFIVNPPITRPLAIPADPATAAHRERMLKDRVRPFGPVPDPLYHVAGIDLRYAEGRAILASASVVTAESLETVETASARHPLPDATPTELLSFHEVLAAIEALRELTIAPGVITCVGDGPSHPADFNFATHLGVRTGTPTFGVSGDAYLGTYDEPGPERGDQSDLVDDGKVIGRVVCTQAGQPPVFVTQGQRLGLDGAVELTLRLTENGSRLPASTVAAASALEA